ncbi:hypothetical protein [uncultured Hyphomicrobium sp.]|uniref:hypothetical protein n=2 Tax=Hyphomicrobium TaxID=81 RepID=UPI0025FDB3C9|nr:hypothetical protein [uncultured Hyphomicrobium sp.]
MQRFHSTALLAAAVVMLPLAATQAQSPLDDPQLRATDVSVNFSLIVPYQSADIDAQETALQAGRSKLYEIAGSECAKLLKTIASQCQLSRLNVQTAMPRNPQRQTEIVLSANASYRIRTKELLAPK